MPGFPDHPISSRRRYDHFGTSPEFAIIIPFLLSGNSHRVQVNTFFAALRLAALLIFALLLGSCDKLGHFAELGPPGPNQPLVVILSNDPAFQEPAAETPARDGFGRELVALFASHLGVEVRLITENQRDHSRDALLQNKAHMLAVVPIEGNALGLLFSPALFETPQVIVQHADAMPLDGKEKLGGRKIVLPAGVPQARALMDLGIVPPPRLSELTGKNDLDLLADLAEHRHECVATDELHFDLASLSHPDLEIALKLPHKVAYGFAFSPAHPQLQTQAAEFFAAIRQDGTLKRLYDGYYGHIKRLDGQDVSAFLEAVQSRLPALRRHFEEAERISGIDWRLIAALAWQESHWNALATSPTGVRGIMMLTEETADRLGVKNRLDVRESILAGARYLAMLLEELPDEIHPQERLWFALAAYNLGMGYLRGGRQFASGLKKSPNHWADMKEVLPLLARPEYYTRLKSGRARGGETVIMVENVRSYYDILVSVEPHRQTVPLQTGLTMQ